MKKFIKKDLVFIIMIMLLPVTMLIMAIAKNSPWLTEHFYSRTVYPVLSAAVSLLTGIFPVPIAEILLIALIILVLYTLIWAAVHIKKLRLTMIVKAFMVLVSAACAGYFLFNIMWGLNYYRLPLMDNLNYKNGDVTKEELAAIYSSETDSINSLIPKIKFDSKNHSYYEGGIAKMQKQTNNGFTRLSAGFSLFDNVKTHPKRVMMSEIMSYAGIDGIFIPFTYEPCINSICPSFIIPSNMAHESAHLKGFAREDEANFISYLADTRNSDPYFQYSAHMSAYIYIGNALNKTDSGLQGEISARLNPKAASDLEEYNRYVNRFAGPVQDISQNINDSYLKSQGQQQGVVSYDMFVNLLCAKYRTDTQK